MIAHISSYFYTRFSLKRSKSSQLPCQSKEFCEPNISNCVFYETHSPRNVRWQSCFTSSSGMQWGTFIFYSRTTKSVDDNDTTAFTTHRFNNGKAFWCTSLHIPVHSHKMVVRKTSPSSRSPTHRRGHISLKNPRFIFFGTSSSNHINLTFAASVERSSCVFGETVALPVHILQALYRHPPFNTETNRLPE